MAHFMYNCWGIKFQNEGGSREILLIIMRVTGKYNYGCVGNHINQAMFQVYSSTPVSFKLMF
jgi:hypothetical protein